MKARFRGEETKYLRHDRQTYVFPANRWVAVDDIGLFKRLKQYPKRFDVVQFYDIKPLEIIASKIRIDKELIFTHDTGAARRLDKLPFMKLQARRPEEKLWIYRIVSYDNEDLSRYSNVMRPINALIYRSLGGIGDIIMTFPILEIANGLYPHFKTTYACPHQFVSLAENSPFIDGCSAFNIQTTKEDWDVVTNLTSDCIRYEVNNQPRVSMNRTEVFAKKCGFGDGNIPRPKIFLSESEILGAKDEVADFKDKLKIGIVLKSNAPVRNWPYFEELKDLINAKYPDCMLIEFCIEQPAGWVESKNSYPVFGRSLREVAALINECDLVVSPDTGLAHISSALRVPTVWIFTHITGYIRTNCYDNVWVVQKKSGNCPEGRPCWYKITCGKEGERELKENPVCATEIKADDVMKSINAALRKPNLSYVVVYKDQYEITARCLELIKQFKKANEEIVLVDNGSEKPFEFQDDDSIVFLRNDQNLGCAIGRNQGMKAANGRFILTLDNDQYIDSITVHRLMNTEGDVVGVEGWSMDNSGFAFDVSEEKGPLAYVGAGGMLVKKHAAEDIGYFDEVYKPAWFEDPDFCYRAKEKGYSIGHCTNGKVKHLAHRTIYSQRDFDPQKAWEKSHKTFVQRWLGSRKPKAGGKPVVMLVCDVIGWAWDYKAKQIVRYLGDEFDFKIAYLSMKPYGLKADVLLTFECDPSHFKNFEYKKYITGVTAHTYPNLRDWKRCLSIANAVHANSFMLYEEIKQYNPNHFYVPNGVDLDIFKYKERDLSEPFTVGFVGKDIPRKGLKDFVEPACERAGVRLKKHTARYNSENRLDQEKMSEFYEDIDVILIASDMDGTPNQLLEAAAVGRTFIGNRIGNVPQFAEYDENGIIVNRSIDEYVSNLVRLKRDRELCAKLGKKARATVEEKWTWKGQSEAYRHLIRSVL